MAEPSKPQPPATPDKAARSAKREAPPTEHDLDLPHERDQQDGEVNPTPDPVIEQAKDDLDAGLVDTDMRSTPGLDTQRRKDLVKKPSTRKTT